MRIATAPATVCPGCAASPCRCRRGLGLAPARVDLESYPARGAIDERTLAYAYRNATRPPCEKTAVAPCACGGEIRVDAPLTDRRIETAVRIHNESTAHRQWRQRLVDAGELADLAELAGAA